MRPTLSAATAAFLAFTPVTAQAATIFNAGGIGHTVDGRPHVAGLYFELTAGLNHGQTATIGVSDLRFLQGYLYGNVELQTLTFFTATVYSASDDDMGLHLLSMSLEGVPEDPALDYHISAIEKGYRTFDRSGSLVASGVLWGVPEPSAWILALAGFGISGWRLRGSRSSLRAGVA